MKKICRNIVQWLACPALIVGAVTTHLYLVSNGWSAVGSIYLPVLLTAAMVMLLERVMPYRRSWAPGVNDVRTDLVFMVVTQVAIPKLLAIAAGLWVMDAIQNWDLTFHFWPAEVPLSVQFVLLILGGSFVRYWTHRAAHEWPLLWRLHTVHHSPDKLYWLNLGRFHPGEELIRFATETLPFMVLGVSETVMHLYFVLLATNGFLFHSNICLRHGPLNYLLVTAELHRWHHVRDRRVSACNYGNLLSVWDLLFGTYYLPVDREVGPLGLMIRRFPTTFFRQISAPFVTGSGEQNAFSPPVPAPTGSRSNHRYGPKIRGNVP